MRVKNLMASLMLLTLGLSGNVQARDVTVPLSATGGVRIDYEHSSNAIAIISNLYKQVSFSLGYQDRLQHTKTMIYAASVLDTGETALWSNPDNGTAGRMRVVMTRPAQGGVCRLMFVEVEKSGHVREYQEWACKTIDSQFWTFSAR